LEYPVYPYAIPLRGEIMEDVVGVIKGMTDYLMANAERIEMVVGIIIVWLLVNFAIKEDEILN
jgi:hypothetical protein